MNRTDRLLAIVLELQGKGRQRAEDLAATFETSKRTIYRDIQALCEAGIPVIAQPGQGYALMEGYFLPPVRFSRDEALLLLLGGDLIAQQVDAQYQTAAQEAARKITAVLPPTLREEVNYLQENIRFLVPERDHPAVLNHLQLLRTAIIARQRVHFRYYARSNDHEPTERTLDPYGLLCHTNVWYVAGYCHLRQALRHFRLERMEALVALEQTFVRSCELNLGCLTDHEPYTVVVRLRFQSQIARRVREKPSYFMVAQQEDEAGLVVTLHVRQEEDIVPWLLTWGAQVRVLEPISLQRRLLIEAKDIIEQYL